MNELGWTAIHIAASDGLLALADTFNGRDLGELMTIGEVVTLLVTTAELHRGEVSGAEPNPVVPTKRSPFTGRYK